jgi:hypothetical protein
LNLSLEGKKKMRNISKKFLLVTLTVFFCVLGYSQVSLADDNHALPMLRMGVGARALAMGGIYGCSR